MARPEPVHRFRRSKRVVVRYVLFMSIFGKRRPTHASVFLGVLDICDRVHRLVVKKAFYKKKIWLILPPL